MSEYAIAKIQNGTVIDHIRSGYAIMLVKMLGLENYLDSLYLGMNLKSARLGQKDIIKIENRFFHIEELNKIALLSPNATIILIENFQIKQKSQVTIPSFVEGLFKCPSPTCITQIENCASHFQTINKGPFILLECVFCQKQTSLTSALICPR